MIIVPKQILVAIVAELTMYGFCIAATARPARGNGGIGLPRRVSFALQVSAALYHRSGQRTHQRRGIELRLRQERQPHPEDQHQHRRSHRLRLRQPQPNDGCDRYDQCRIADAGNLTVRCNWAAQRTLTQNRVPSRQRSIVAANTQTEFDACVRVKPTRSPREFTTLPDSGFDLRRLFQYRHPDATQPTLNNE